MAGVKDWELLIQFLLSIVYMLHMDRIIKSYSDCRQTYRRDVSSIPVQLYFKGDNVVDILQHVSHCGVGSVCHTGQRHRVPLADLDQA